MRMAGAALAGLGGSNPILGKFSMDHEDSVFRDDGSGGIIGTVRQEMKKQEENQQEASEVGPAGGTNSDGQTGIAANFTGLADRRKPWAGLQYFQGV